jgi:predicted nucleic acid-binding protein
MASGYVVDTNALVWYLTDSPRLSAVAREALDKSEVNAERLLIPTIVLAELLGLARKRKVSWPEVLAALFKIDSSDSFEVQPFSWEDIRRITRWHYTGTLDSPDLHDPIILAAAESSAAKLVTSDRDLSAQTIVETIW